MGDLVDNKFTWVIKNFSLQSTRVCSEHFLIGGCKLRLSICPKFLYMKVTEFSSLPTGWRRHAKVYFTLVNQLSEKLSQRSEAKYWFNGKSCAWGFTMLSIVEKLKLHERDSGFLVNGELKVTVEVDVLEVIGQLDETESEGTSHSLKKRKQDYDGVLSRGLLDKTQQLKEVDGFLVLPSQAESVKRIFEKHPNMALKFRAKNQNLRTTCMNVLLNLMETLCLQDLSVDDLSQADNALTYLKNSGFKVDWLERKLDEVKEKKTEEEIGEIRIQELEEELKGFQQKYTDIEALLEIKREELKDLNKKCFDTEALLKKEKAKVLAAKAHPLTLDDVV